VRLGWSPLAALREGRFKIIDAPRPELYDLDADPFELRNLIRSRAHAGVREKLRRELARLVVEALGI
jgi:arylsulfatase A-like enzyme